MSLVIPETLFEEGSYHIDPLVMAEAVRRFPYLASSALAASLVVKPTSGLLRSVTVYNNKGSAQFIQLHDTSGVPAEGAVPVWVVSVATVASAMFSFTPPRALRNGIVFCNSSTAATKTLGSADCFFSVDYV